MPSSDASRRAWREAFCYWIGDAMLAAVCSAAGGPIGLLVLHPNAWGFSILSLVAAFILGLAAALIVRTAVRPGSYNRWMGGWLLVGAIVGSSVPWYFL
jgi:hypothetical protein